MTSASAMRRKPARERTARTCAAVLTAFLFATLTVGCGWLGGPSRITDNRRILNSLPIPAGVGQISIDSHYHTQGDSLLAPPDGWAPWRLAKLLPSFRGRESWIPAGRDFHRNGYRAWTPTTSLTPLPGSARKKWETPDSGEGRLASASTLTDIDRRPAHFRRQR